MDGVLECRKLQTQLAELRRWIRVEGLDEELEPLLEWISEAEDQLGDVVMELQEGNEDTDADESS
jgi:DNA repair ATPase RecN